MSSLNMIARFSSLGLETSAVRDVSEAFKNEEEQKLGLTIGVFRSLIWFTGIAGVLIVIALSPYLSQWAFGNQEYTMAFIFLSLIVLVNQLKTGKVILLRGTRRIKDLAIASFISSLITLFIILPIYYFLGIEGIVPALIIASLIGYGTMHYFTKSIQVSIPKLTTKKIFKVGQDMLRMGFFLSLTGTIALAVAYFIRLYISQEGSIIEVGLYTAGITIINSYVGLVFSAMGTDYFPRLSGVSKIPTEFNQIINHQADVALLLLGPILCVFMIVLKWAIVLLYSAEFLPIYTMLMWMCIATYLKAACWPLGFAILAKGNSKLFFYKESFVHIFMFISSVLAFQWKGLEGVGVAYLITYVVNALLLIAILKVKYSFIYSKTYLTTFAIQFPLGILVFLLLIKSPTSTYYISSIIVCLLVSFLSFQSLDKKIDLMTHATILTKFFNKDNKPNV